MSLDTPHLFTALPTPALVGSDPLLRLLEASSSTEVVNATKPDLPILVGCWLILNPLLRRGSYKRKLHTI